MPATHSGTPGDSQCIKVKGENLYFSQLWTKRPIEKDHPTNVFSLEYTINMPLSVKPKEELIHPRIKNSFDSKRCYRNDKWIFTSSSYYIRTVIHQGVRGLTCGFIRGSPSDLGHHESRDLCSELQQVRELLRHAAGWSVPEHLKERYWL